MSHVIAVASGKGGVGKTLITASLAIALRRRGYTVLAVDADMGMRNLDLLLGVQDEVFFDVYDVMKKRCKAADALVPVGPVIFWQPVRKKRGKRQTRKISSASFHA